MEMIFLIIQKLGCLAIKRPESLATDFSSSEDGWIHAIDYIEKKKIKRLML